MRYAIAILIAITPGGGARAAGPVQCAEGKGVYQAVTGPAHEMTFAGDKGTLALMNGRTRLVYPFAVTQSNGFSRTSIVVAGKDAPSSVAMSYNPDFTPYRGDGSAAYLVTPDLPVGFYYWEAFRSRPNHIDLLPSDAWRLVRCSPSGNGSTH